jgi:hypothetical protein
MESLASMLTDMLQQDQDEQDDEQDDEQQHDELQRQLERERKRRKKEKKRETGGREGEEKRGKGLVGRRLETKWDLDDGSSRWYIGTVLEEREEEAGSIQVHVEYDEDGEKLWTSIPNVTNR